MEEKTAKKVMLSGIQPSGDLTLGSYYKKGPGKAGSPQMHFFTGRSRISPA
jgi:hypothetical protein